MDRIPGAKSSKNTVSPAELMICELCGALNHESNRECFTCGWRGRFGRDTATIELAWRRLDHQHEGVLREHVTARGTAIVDELGRSRQTNGLQRLTARFGDWCKDTLAARRPRRTPQADAPQPAAPQREP